MAPTGAAKENAPREDAASHKALILSVTFADERPPEVNTTLAPILLER